MAEKHIAKRKRKDGRGEKTEKNYKRQQKKLNRRKEKISAFPENMEIRTSTRKKEIKSNVTDNESVMIHISSGYIQGYIGTAVTDGENQIIIDANAVGTANECGHLPVTLGPGIGKHEKGFH